MNSPIAIAQDVEIVDDDILIVSQNEVEKLDTIDMLLDVESVAEQQDSFVSKNEIFSENSISEESVVDETKLVVDEDLSSQIFEEYDDLFTDTIYENGESIRKIASPKKVIGRLLSGRLRSIQQVKLVREKEKTYSTEFSFFLSFIKWLTYWMRGV